MNYHDKNLSEVISSLGSDASAGLGARQAERLHGEYGPNRLTEKKKTSIVVRFLMQFNDFMIMILLAAAGVSFWASLANGERDFLDPIIILCIVAVNAVLGLVQEYRAEHALEALKKMSAPVAKVIRDGRLTQMASDELVPGDLIVLDTGDFVPADARLVEAVNLRIDEAALTGESVPVEKSAESIAKPDAPLGDRHNMVFSGSAITYGHGTALVTSTGMNTEMGRIAMMLIDGDAPETPLQRKLADTGKKLGLAALGICFLIFVLGVFRRIEPFEMFMTSVSLAVAAIPEGLPAIVTIMLSIGVQRMAGRGAIIRKLPAVETLGGASVICSDKTGTLTQNKMAVVEITGDKRGVLKLAALCNDTRLDGVTLEAVGDPTEKALVLAALNLEIDKNKLARELPRVAEIPFDSTRKLMTTVHKTPAGKYLSVTKGAPDVLIPRCTRCEDDGTVQMLTQPRERGLLTENRGMAAKALRVIAVAYRELDYEPYRATSDLLERDLVFAGLVGMMDPPREEARAAVETCLRAGIKPVMITGDHAATAAAIAAKLGILSPKDSGKIMTGDELSRMPQDELNRKIYDYSVFARVSPEHKVRIVKAFQANSAVVAMTGDGVNDAPALKAADIGCAMGITGTDVAKSAADMVLTDDNFATIVEAVREGRGIFDNIRKSVHFLLSSNIGEIITIFSAILMGWQSPLLAIHLLWVNLVTDSLPAIALGLDPASNEIMDRKPNLNNKNLFDGHLWQRIATEGVMIGMLSLLAFGIGMVFYNLRSAQTMAFATLSISQLVHAFNMRSEKSLLLINPFDNLYLVGAFIAGVVLQVGVIMIAPIANIFRVVPLSAAQWLAVLLLCLMPIVIVELQKFMSEREDSPRPQHTSKQMTA